MHIESAHNESECSSEYNSDEDNEEYTTPPSKIRRYSKDDNEDFEETVSNLSDDSNSSHQDELLEKSRETKTTNGITSNVSKKSKGATAKVKEEAITPSVEDKSELRPFACEHCPKRFLRLHDFQYHNASTHRPTKDRINLWRPITVDGITMRMIDWHRKKGAQFKCKVVNCKAKFTSDYELQKHSKLHGEFPCNFCSKICTFASDLANHELEHTDLNKNRTEYSSKTLFFKCARCSYKSKFKERYVTHHLGEHLDGLESDRLRCPICKASFCTKDNTHKSLLMHYTSHHDLYERDPETIQRCDQCSAYFINNLQLDTHVTNIHMEWKKFPCADCNAVFSRKSVLNIHRLKVHKKSGELPFVCDVGKECQKRFETQVRLDRHKMLKHSEKSSMLMCTQCGKKFLGTSALLHHMKSHKEKVQKGRQFVCDLCGKAYKEKHCLEVHMLFHAGPDSWKFSCSVCGKKIVSKQKLTEHMRTHTKEKPFACQVCGEKYAHRHNLKNHVKSKHGIDVAIRKVEDTTLFASSRKGKKTKTLSVKVKQEKSLLKP